MSTPEFRKLKNRIEKMLDEAENEALKGGANIASVDFQNVLNKLKEKLLEEHGLTVLDYEMLELQLESSETKKEVDENEVIEMGERVKTASDARKAEFKQKNEELATNFKRDIEEASTVFQSDLAEERKKRLSSEDIIKIVKPLIPKIPKVKIPEIRYYDDAIEMLEKKVDSIKMPEAKDYSKEMAGLYKAYEKLKKDKDKDGDVSRKEFEQFKERLTAYERFKVSEVSDVPNYKDNETPVGTINRTNKVFTLANTPNPTESLLLLLNGSYRSPGGEDYTLAGDTITFVRAPVTNSVLRAFYRH